MAKKTIKKKVVKKATKKQLASTKKTSKISSKPATKFPWFRKREGAINDKWGFIPINWKGWTALIILIAINVFAVNYFDVMNSPLIEVSKFLIVFLLSMAIFVLIAEQKTKK
ncbi:MAG: hypothetical protein OEL87_01830 [Nanoarchaeota archaeon]|nr:hypothetical protein [Nanoarchaeota archaeon]